MLAAVDVGTNSLHLVVARTTEGDRFEVIAREKEMVRLGSGATHMKELDPAAVDRAVAALDRYRRLADRHGAPLRAVATSAVREARDRDREAFLNRARDEAGVEVEVVSGVEEARLIHLGVLQGLELFDRRLLLCDIGGGSTELLVGERSEVLASVSVKLGAVRLTNRFFAGGTLHPSAVESCRRHIREVLSSFERPVRRLGFEVAVGSSGTIEQVLRIARARAGEDPLRTLNGAVLRREQVAEVAKAAIRARERGDLDGLPDLDPKREDIVLAGALVLEGVVERFGIEELLVSEYALREGVLLDTIARHRGGTLPHLRDVARRSVTDLMTACDEDPAHAEQVARLALALFDELRPVHGLDDDARALLEAGALLANVGLVISHAQHHKHSYYLIRNSDRLVGFTDGEIELVALIARYHRRSSPRASHPEWTALEADEQRIVAVCAGILRIAIGLDRGHRGLVEGVRIEGAGGGGPAKPTKAAKGTKPSKAAKGERRATEDRTLRIVGELAAGVTLDDAALEAFAAEERTGLLAETLDRPVVIELAVR